MWTEHEVLGYDYTRLKPWSGFKDRMIFEGTRLPSDDELGELSTGIQTTSCCDARLVVLGKELPDQFTSAPHPNFLENSLEVVLYSVGRDVKRLGNFSCG